LLLIFSFLVFLNSFAIHFSFHNSKSEEQNLCFANSESESTKSFLFTIQKSENKESNVFIIETSEIKEYFLVTIKNLKTHFLKEILLQKLKITMIYKVWISCPNFKNKNAILFF
jgi:hypothetical protein